MIKTIHSGPNVPLLDIHVAIAVAIKAIKVVHLKIGRFYEDKSARRNQGSVLGALLGKCHPTHRVP